MLVLPRPQERSGSTDSTDSTCASVSVVSFEDEEVQKSQTRYCFLQSQEQSQPRKADDFCPSWERSRNKEEEQTSLESQLDGSEIRPVDVARMRNHSPIPRDKVSSSPSAFRETVQHSDVEIGLFKIKAEVMGQDGICEQLVGRQRSSTLPGLQSNLSLCDLDYEEVDEETRQRFDADLQLAKHGGRRSVHFSSDLPQVDFLPDDSLLNDSRKGSWGIAPFHDEYWDGERRMFRETPISKEELETQTKRHRKLMFLLSKLDDLILRLDVTALHDLNPFNFSQRFEAHYGTAQKQKVKLQQRHSLPLSKDTLNTCPTLEANGLISPVPPSHKLGVQEIETNTCLRVMKGELSRYYQSLLRNFKFIKQSSKAGG